MSPTGKVLSDSLYGPKGGTKSHERFVDLIIIQEGPRHFIPEMVTREFGTDLSRETLGFHDRGGSAAVAESSAGHFDSVGVTNRGGLRKRTCRWS